MIQSEFIRSILGNPFACIVMGIALIYGLFLSVHAFSLKLWGKKKNHTDLKDKASSTGKSDIKKSPSVLKGFEGLYISKETEMFRIREQLKECSETTKEPEVEDNKKQEILYNNMNGLIELISDLADSRDSHCEIISSLQDRLDSFSSEFEGTLTCHSDLTHRQNEDITRLTKKIKNLQHERKICIKAKKDLFKKVKALYTAKLKVGKWLAGCCNKLDKIRRKYEKSALKLEKRIHNLVKEKTVFKTDFLKYHSNTGTMAERNGVHKKLLAYRKKCAELEKYVGIYRKTVADTVEQIRKMRTKHAKSGERIENRITKMGSKNVYLRNELSECLLEKEISLIENEDTAFSEQLEEYRLKCAEFSEQMMSLEVENESLKTELSKRLKKESADQEETPVMKTLYRENKELSKKIEEYRSMIDTMHVELEEFIAFREEYIRYYNEHGNGDAWDPSEFAALSDSNLVADIKESDYPERDQASSTQEEDMVEEAELADIPGVVSKAGKNGKLYNIFLPKLTSLEKKKKAIPLIMEIAGLPEEEAKKLSDKTIIPVIKRITGDEADSIKKQFLDAGILPRVKRQV